MSMHRFVSAAAPWLGRWALLPVALVAGALHAEEQTPNPLAPHYGFGRLELYKLEERSANLRAADLNHDGLTDLVLIDNSNSRLDVLQQREKPPGPSITPSAGGKVNAIENDKRFEHKKIPVDRQIASLAVGDFNGDGRKDLVWFAVPDQLTVALQTPGADWTSRRRFRLPDVQPEQGILAVGDLNGDGKDDIAVLGKHDTHLLFQQPAGDLAPPVRLMNTSDGLSMAQIADLDGDGRGDLSYLSSADQERPLCVRLQGADKRLGPELRCEMPRPRGVTIAELDGKPGHEILSVEAQTGRVKAYRLQRPELQPGEPAAQLIQYGFGQQSSAKARDIALGDVDGDGRIDAVVTDPEASQVVVFLQQKEGGLDLGTPFPGLVAPEQIRIGDVDGDSRAEVVVLSTREKTIGTSRMENGRLTFPSAVPLEREPAVLELADLDGNGRPELVYLSKERSSQATKYSLAAATWQDGQWRPFRFGAQDVVPLSIRNTPERLSALDANFDGRTDFLIFIGGERAPVFLLTGAQGVPAEVSASEGGFGPGSSSAGGLFVGALERPVVLVAQNNFARSLFVNEKNQWQVIDQYNAPESDAKIVGAATLDLDGEPGREIVLVDQGVKKLRVLRREEAVYRPWREVDIGAFPYRSAHVADLNGDGRDDLLLFGTGKFGVLYAGRTDPRLASIATYETKLEHVYFNTVVAGDLNADGVPDVAAIDTQSQYVDLVNFTPVLGLRHALHFRVFEAKGLVREERTGTEPREAIVADVTHDGREDLILLSQDRVLVYPQDGNDE